VSAMLVVAKAGLISANGLLARGQLGQCGRLLDVGVDDADS
jgi:hypothetical protein